MFPNSPSGERAESRMGKGRGSPSSIPCCFPSQFWGSPGLQLPGLCPAWRRGCRRSLAIPKFAVGASSCLAPRVSTSRHCSHCQSQHMENLCGFGEGLLSLHSWGPILLQQVQACSISGHSAFDSSVLVLPRAPQSSAPLFWVFYPHPQPEPSILIQCYPKTCCPGGILVPFCLCPNL